MASFVGSPSRSRNSYAGFGPVGGGSMVFAGGRGPGGAYAGGTIVPGGRAYAVGEPASGIDMGCGGVGGMCFEPAGTETADGNWAYVGNGRGNYEQVQQLQFVGAGGAYDQQKMVTYNGWKCRTGCIVFMILLILAGIGLLTYFLIPTSNESREEATVQATQPFDCQAGLWNWDTAWSMQKKHWCCDHHNKGCHTTTSLPYDCDAGFSNWQAGWSVSKKQWCCVHANRGCVVITQKPSKPYECSAGLSNWAEGWSAGKKLWCCAKENLGCATSLPYDCNAGLSNWQVGWSTGKKMWCCAHQAKGCHTTTSLPYDCAAGFSNWAAGWSLPKKQWCCIHTNKGCATTTLPPRTGSCTLWGDPHIFTFDQSRLVFYSEGDFWIVKSDAVQIQGRFQATDWTRKNDKTDYSSMTGIVISGPFIQNHKIQVEPMDSGKIKCDGQEILHQFGTTKCGGAMVYYNQQGQLVDNAMAFLPHKVVHMELPNKVVIQVNRWPNFINAKITMSQVTGQDGVCGDFNGVVKNGLSAGKELHAKFGYGVPSHELLFPNSIPLHIPAKSPSSKRCSPAKRQKAEQICHQEAANAVGWSFAECLGDVCDPHSSATAEEMRAALTG